MPFKRKFDAVRPATLGCCVCLLLVAPQSLPAQTVKKAVVDEIIHSLSEHLRPADENIARRAERNLSPETRRSIKAMEAIRKLKADPELENVVSVLWDGANDATKKRAELEASELERDCKEEADRLKKKERFSEECGKELASALIKTACFCAKERLRTGSWLTENASDKFAAEVASAEIQCASLGLAHHISQVANAEVARYAVPATKAAGKGIAKAGAGEEASQSSEEPDGTGLAALIHELCRHE